MKLSVYLNIQRTLIILYVIQFCNNSTTHKGGVIFSSDVSSPCPEGHLKDRSEFLVLDSLVLVRVLVLDTHVLAFVLVLKVESLKMSCQVMLFHSNFASTSL